MGALDVPYLEDCCLAVEALLFLFGEVQSEAGGPNSVPEALKTVKEALKKLGVVSVP